MPIIAQLTSVSKAFGERVVLDKVDLNIEAGSSLAIIGPSGAGKSTLLNLLGALDIPDTGSVLIADQNPVTLSDDQRAKLRSQRLGFIFQDHHLLPHCTVIENVLIPAYAFASKISAETLLRAQNLLAKVGLAGRENSWPRQLSGGERQRVAVVRALINQPSLLLCDEPTGALDHRSAQALGDLLLALQKESGTALVVVTHQRDLAARMDRRLELIDGKLQATE
jgi:ABC-type lipoprotein export system ATPase subunit